VEPEAFFNWMMAPISVCAASYRIAPMWQLVSEDGYYGKRCQFPNLHGTIIV
jgi:hypothetical protein